MPTSLLVRTKKSPEASKPEVVYHIPSTDNLVAKVSLQIASSSFGAGLRMSMGDDHRLSFDMSVGLDLNLGIFFD
jgi:hypothetical protein